MNRYWLVPYLEAGSGSDVGCGSVGWRRPVAWVLQRLGVAVRVHEILRSDDLSVLHDHPWNYVSVILKNGYIEATEGHYRYYGEGCILLRSAKSAHCLELVLEGSYEPAPVPATTLFITGPWKQTWGFFPDGVKVPHFAFRGKRKESARK